MKIKPAPDSISLNRNLISEFFTFVNGTFPLYVKINTNLRSLLLITRIVYFLIGLIVGINGFDYLSKEIIVGLILVFIGLEVFLTIHIWRMDMKLRKIIKDYSSDFESFDNEIKE